MASWQQVPGQTQARQGADLPWRNAQQVNSPGLPSYSMAYAPVINVQCVNGERPKSKKQENSQPKSSRRQRSSRMQPPPPTPKRQTRPNRGATSKVPDNGRRQHKNNLRARNHHQIQSTNTPPRPCDRCGEMHWHRRCPRLIGDGFDGGSPISMPPSASPSRSHASTSIMSSRDSTFVPESTVSHDPANHVDRLRYPHGGNNDGLDGILASFRGFCCAVGNPTLADLQSTWVKLHRRRLEGTLEPPVRQRWNYLIRVATRERRADEDGQLWAMLLV